MVTRIKCPECEKVLPLSKLRPGRFLTRCKYCDQPFRLQISEDTPPVVKVWRHRQDANQTASSSTPDGAQQAKVSAATVTQGAAGNITHPGGTGAVESTVTPGSAQASPAQASPAQANSAQANSAQANPSPTNSAQPTRSVDDLQATIETSAEAKMASQTAGKADTTRGQTVETGMASENGSQHQAARPQPESAASCGENPPPAAQGDQAARPETDQSIPEKLGGYRIVRLLGRGAMGAVYEAKQVSLDRLVALKTIRDRLARNASSLARFTREAYAAAQLTHHNVVQIYDFGEDSGKHFFSMEWVRGGPLSDLVREKGAIDPRLAAGYILQAARGLQFAHRHGMVHRDVKPANLLLSEDGIVKVADLGLVKIPESIDPDSDVGALSISGAESGTQVTLQGTAVGTPAFMAPEQSVDAAGVDHRADIYSLGCTLFFLLTGRPPFGGGAVSEVLEQHTHQPLPNLREINARVPEPLQEVVEHCTAKRPDNRYGSLAKMISDLESFLGVNQEGVFSPTAQQADQWEELSQQYANSTRLLGLTKPLLATLLIVCALATLAAPLVALGWLLLGPTTLLTAVGAAILAGSIDGKSPLVASGRRWFGSLSWFDCAVGLSGALVLLLVALATGMLIGLVAGTLLGTLLGLAYHFMVTIPTRRKSAQPLQQAERFIRNLRIEGADEEGVRVFAARYGGKHWQGIFEAVFGYEAFCKVQRQLSSDSGFRAPRATLRDRVCQSLSAKAERNRQARDHKRLAKIEEKGLQSEGLTSSEARDRAWQMAAAVMDHAKNLPAADTDAQAAAQAKRERMKAMLADARSGKYVKKRDSLAWLRFALSGQTRLLAGCLLLGMFAIWAQQNGLLEQVQQIAGAAQTSGTIGQQSVDELKQWAQAVDSESGKSWSIGIAGLLLAMSAFVSGWRMTPFAVAATIVILFGRSLGIPPVGESLHAWMVSALVGVAIYIPGILFGETKEY
ncbi:MAG: protein kinase [Pirellulales bacterium]|nr:protein kinase [Pirellulales bacterium]